MIHHLMLEKSDTYRYNRMYFLFGLAARLDAKIVARTKSIDRTRPDEVLMMLLSKRDRVSEMLREVRS